jgi:hypothetical protein
VIIKKALIQKSYQELQSSIISNYGQLSNIAMRTKGMQEKYVDILGLRNRFLAKAAKFLVIQLYGLFRKTGRHSLFLVNLARI